jgi:hypothetical protein
MFSFEGFEKTKVVRVVLLFENMEEWAGWQESNGTMRKPELPVTAGRTRQRFYACKEGLLERGEEKAFGTRRSK